MVMLQAEGDPEGRWAEHMFDAYELLGEVDTKLAQALTE